jgi:hypothetical protein
MTASRTRLSVLLGTLALVAAWALSAPSPASACVGGMEFGWAVAHTRGWIAAATVVESDNVPVGFYRVDLGEVEALKGSPPTLDQTTLAMGAVCDQTPHVGDRVLVLDDVAIEPPYDTPIAYVIRGADANAIQAADVARVLRSMPATDAAPGGNASSSPSSESVVWLIGVGLATAWFAMRRFGRSAPAQVGSTRSRPQR